MTAFDLYIRIVVSEHHYLTQTGVNRIRERIAEMMEASGFGGIKRTEEGKIENEFIETIHDKQLHL